MSIIYKITNLATKKSYIGYTSKTLDIRWRQHIKRSLCKKLNSKFDNALRKYDISDWHAEILEENLSIVDSKLREIYYINLFDSYDNGYNSTFGGDGNNGIIMSVESNKKRSNALRGIPKKYNRMLGKFHTKETKIKISAAHLGKKKPWVKWSSEQISKRAIARRSLSLEKYTLMQEFKKMGHSRKEIAELLNVSFGVVKKWINKPWEL